MNEVHDACGNVGKRAVDTRWRHEKPQFQRHFRRGITVASTAVTVLRIPFQQALAFEVAADALSQSLRQPRKLRTGRFSHPAQTQRAIRTLDLHPVEERGIKLNVEVQRAAEALTNRQDRL